MISFSIRAHLLTSLLAWKICNVSGLHALNFVNLLEPSDAFKCVAVQVGELASPGKLVSAPLCYEERLLIQSTETSGQVNGIPIYIFPVNDEDQSVDASSIALHSANIYEDDTRNVWFLHRNSSVSDQVLLRNIDNGDVEQTLGYISFVNFADSPVDLALRETAESYLPMSNMKYYDTFNQIHNGAFSRSYQYRYIVDEGAENAMTGFFRVGFREGLDLGHTINTVFYGKNEANSFQSLTFRATTENDFVIGPVNYAAAISTEPLSEPTAAIDPTSEQTPDDTAINNTPNNVPEAVPPVSNNDDVNNQGTINDDVVTNTDGGDDGIIVYGNEDTDATAGDWCIVVITGLVYIVLIVALCYWTFLLTSTWWELRKRMRGDIGHAKSAKTKILVDVKEEEEEKKKKRSKRSGGGGGSGDAEKKKKVFSMMRDRMGSRRMKDALSSMSNGRLFGEEGDNQEYIKRARALSKANLHDDVALDMPSEDITKTKSKGKSSGRV
ncbi:hypothetical protein SARC_02494 [Sphaeroforma arctica JP610]|uniref:Uncharacterized protein n=1 Tax=Sphaeroforma arctica JP610 TaxID=667725 RepID=A0A0L0G8V3_9EUKA|nr:hypothetical protein SARC_02494 [Sphaeroforma arctica JP610]KNC85311.1 hypothetical protein SARC_02494 [Sphaeroforma arctica JP610]|eukprot:XP_014159213.1 hypothetical protein SARC_02494 [Sphaeroforma arctica JP610]